MRIKASTPLGAKLFELADDIAKAKNPHLWFDNHVTLPESNDRRMITPYSTLTRGLWVLRAEMKLAMDASEFYEAIGGLDLDLPPEREESEFETLARAWNDAQTLLGNSYDGV